MNSKLKSLIATIAPVLGTFAGGPLGGAVVSALSDKLLGKPDGTSDELEAVLGSLTPDRIASIKAAEKAFEADMKRLDVDLERIAADDRASARNREIQTGDKTVPILAGVYTLAYFAYLAAIMLKGMPADETTADMLMLLTGVITTVQIKIADYYFGSSKGSSDKTKMLANGGHK